MAANVERLFAVFAAAGRQLYLVGGAVRDELLGVPEAQIADLDFATDARPDETVRILRGAGIPHHDVGSHFGSIGAILRCDEPGYPKDCQITTYRSAEVYDRETRHPVVTFGDSIDEDLWRRDLSINSIARTASGALYDPYGGAADIAARTLRAIGDPVERLREDPLRALRVPRFIAQLGFAPTPELTAAVRSEAATIQRISHERWLVEMDKLLLGEHAVDALEFLRATGLLGELLPEVAALVGLHGDVEDAAGPRHKDLWAHTLQVVSQTPATPTLRWVALVHDVGKADTRAFDDAGRATFHGHEEVGATHFAEIARRFRFDRERARAVGATIALHGLVPSYRAEWTGAAVRRLVRRAGSELDELLAFARADLTTRFAEKRAAAEGRVDHLEARIRAMEAAHALRPVLPRGLGHAVMGHMGVPPGPAVGRAVARIEAACLDGALPAEPSVEDCLAYLTASDHSD
jgi:poly(A) polymerase